ncbi:MAG: RNA polymerase sigma factor [Polyangiaceae bacterium]|nr:RNA polymerase sigma factor [Polyangiaceae bacterium]
MSEEGYLVPTAAPDEPLPRESVQDLVHPSSAELVALLYRQVAVLAGPRQELDDLVQAAAERALKSLHRFDGRCALSTWTYTIAYRTILDSDRWHARFRRRFVSSEAHELARSESDWDTGQAFLELQRARRLHVALAGLPAKKRAVIVLVEFEGMALKDVSAIVGANERTVRSRLRDARKMLARDLARDPLFGGGEP